MVEVDGLTKRFPLPRREIAPDGIKTKTVVDAVSFSVGDSEIFGVLGPNGAGKTTLFKMLATLIEPDEGVAKVGGHDVVREGNAARQLLAPVLANERSLYWRLPADENIRLYTALQGLRGAAARAEVTRVLEITGLADTGHKMVGQFSTGMRQRLLIARALVGRPRLLLLDEPTRSLDPISARDFRRFLRDTIVRTEGCTVLLATHDAEEVWTLCDRVGVLAQGRMLAVDRTNALRHRTGEDVHEVWMRPEQLPAATDAMRAQGLELLPAGEAEDAAWVRATAHVPGGAEGAARALALLTADAREVARFERRAPTLAELIERVVADERGSADG